MDILEYLKTTVRIASNRRLTRAAFERRQLTEFRRLAAYVLHHSRYYARIMEERQIDPSTCTPAEFPVLTKADLIRNFDEIVTAPDITRRGIERFLHSSRDPQELYLGKYTVIHTSGSSGEVGYLVFDQKAWARGIAQLAQVPFPGFVSRRRRVAFLGATGGHYAGVSMMSATRVPPLSLLYKSEFFEIRAPLAGSIHGLNRFQPDILAGYGHALCCLAEKQLAGDLNIRPRVISNSAEPLPPGGREIIEMAFGPCLRDVYACGEHLVVGVRECGSNSTRLAEDELIIEIHDDHVLVTNMFNRILPLIRYRMNDVLTPTVSHTYGPYRAVTEVVGRTEEIVRFVNCHGAIEALSPHTIGTLLIPHVARFQMRITGDASFIFAIVLNDSATAVDRRRAVIAAEAALKKMLAEREMKNVTFTVLPAAEILADSRTGKFRRIVNVARASNCASVA